MLRPRYYTWRVYDLEEVAAVLMQLMKDASERLPEWQLFAVEVQRLRNKRKEAKKVGGLDKSKNVLPRMRKASIGPRSKTLV